MRSAIAVHLAVTFETPGSVPPTREDDPAGGTKGNNLPPIQRPDNPPVVIDLPPGTRPRIDLFVTIGMEPEGAEKVEPPATEPPPATQSPSESPTTGPRRRGEGNLVGPRRKPS